jgi:two-component sensor histidine kinase
MASDGAVVSAAARNTTNVGRGYDRCSMAAHADYDREFRLAALQAGFWLGWLSIAALFTALLLDRAGGHRLALVGLISSAAAANAVMMALPWRRWLAARRGQVVVDLWTAGLVGFASALLVVGGRGSDFDLLFFLVLPFVASVQNGWRRPVWVGAAGGSFLAGALLAPLPYPGGAVTVRVLLLAAAVLLALTLGQAIRRQAADRARAAGRAELERTLLAEAHHRVKNSLQTVADLLLLARPEGSGGLAFDETAERIRSIAAVHRLLAESRGGRVSAEGVLRAVAAGARVPVAVDADDVSLAAETAQQFGIVANELIENAVRHGKPPVTARLFTGTSTRLQIDDGGTSRSEAVPGLGLQLVKQVVEHGLHGSFQLGPRAEGGARAEVVFHPDADPDR